MKADQKNKRDVIRAKAMSALQRHPAGLRFSELRAAVRKALPTLNVKTINNAIISLEAAHPDSVYKPTKGVYRLSRFRDANQGTSDTTARSAEAPRIPEAHFYPLFAAWLKNDVEDVTQAISLGGNAFRDRWGTPDVLGKAESRASDLIKGPTSIVAAEIKIDTAALVTGFGQACAYRLFCHKSYLVVPRQTPPDEMARLDSLCQMFGIGLVTFNPNSAASPDFRLIVRPVKHEPDLFYTNRYMKQVERQLF
jgi:hypothetical protein